MWSNQYQKNKRANYFLLALKTLTYLQHAENQSFLKKKGGKQLTKAKQSHSKGKHPCSSQKWPASDGMTTIALMRNMRYTQPNLTRRPNVQLRWRKLKMMKSQTRLRKLSGLKMMRLMSLETGMMRCCISINHLIGHIKLPVSEGGDSLEEWHHADIPDTLVVKNK